MSRQDADSQAQSTGTPEDGTFPCVSHAMVYADPANPGREQTKPVGPGGVANLVSRETGLAHRLLPARNLPSPAAVMEKVLKFALDPGLPPLPAGRRRL